MNRLRHIWDTPWQRLLYIMFFTQLATGVAFLSISPFLPLYVKGLGTRTGLSVEFFVGMVYSSHAITMMLVSPFWGYVADRHGRKLMVERAMFGGAVVLVLMAFVRSAEELVFLRCLQGLLTGTASATNAMVASMVPRERIGYSMGLLYVGNTGGFALGPLLGGAMADLFGYTSVFYLTGSLLFMSGMLVLLFVKEEFSPLEVRTDKRISFLGELHHVLRAPGVVATYAMRFMSQMGRMMIVPVLPLFIQTLIAGSAKINSFTGLVTSMGWIATTVSAIYLGRLSDHMGHRRIFVVSCLATAIFYFCQTLITEGWQLLVLQILAGASVGGIVPSISALLATYGRHGEEGAIYGLDNSISSAARAAAPLAGVGVAIWFNLRASFLATGLLFLATGILATAYLPRQKKSILS